ncbi:MAG: PQQ-dependent sugar dehydrogenase [Planctomycetota bacterium]
MRSLLLCALLTGAAMFAAAMPVQAQAPIKTVLFKNGFSSPIQVTAPRSDFSRVYVVERAGRIKVCDINTGVVLSTFLDISALTTTTGERGLMSMAFHPEFDAVNNKDYYVYYTNLAGSIVIARYRAITPLVSNIAASILITIPHPNFSNHNGGQVAFGGDGMLYFAPGDGGSANDPSNNAQNLNNLLGKMARVNVTNTGGPLYTIPANNPYVGIAGMDEIWSIGLRNPFRFAFDRDTGNLIIGDVGQNQIEELDYQPANHVPALGQARNYGWRCMEGNNQTNLGGCNYPNPYPNMIAPFHVYNHGVGVSLTGGALYRGCQIPDLRGSYFFGDYVSAQIFSLKYDGTTVTNLTNRTAQLAPGGGMGISTIVNFGEDAHGELYICDLGGGEVFKIVPVTPVIVGVTSYGVGTPGCAGNQTLSVNCSPVVNNAGFRINTTNCPPSSIGLGIVTDVQDVAGADHLGVGVLLHCALAGATELLTFDATSDGLGVGTALAPVPNNPLLAGMDFYASTLWAWSPVTCVLPGANVYNLSTSNGLAIIIQP